MHITIFKKKFKNYLKNNKLTSKEIDFLSLFKDDATLLYVLNFFYVNNKTSLVPEELPRDILKYKKIAFKLYQKILNTEI